MSASKKPTKQMMESLHAKSNGAKYPKSPLRYPGGKARAVEIILRLIPGNIKELVSPFLGGGSVEIAAASLGVRVKGFDIFEPLVHFWQALKNDPEELVRRVRKYYPLPKEKFYELQKASIDDPMESGAVFYVLNRSSFSGATLSGGMGPGHLRFTESSISYLSQFKAPSLSVDFGDFHEVIPASNAFMYLDPPYLIRDSLYGRKGDTHKGFDHAGLCELLKKREAWILSYNNCPEIMEMYSGHQMIVPEWAYGMANDKKSRELLILSKDISSSQPPTQPNLFS